MYAQAPSGLNHCAGVVKAWHIDSAKLWMQDSAEMHEFELCKILGGHIPACGLTKPVPHDLVNMHLASLRCLAVPSTLTPHG